MTEPLKKEPPRRDLSRKKRNWNRRKIDLSDASTQSKPGDQPAPVHPLVPGGVSAAALLAAGLMSFKLGIRDTPQTLVFSVLLAIGIAGFAGMLRGTANLRLGHWFAATGVLATLIASLLLILRAMGIKIDWHDQAGLMDLLNVMIA